MALGRKRKFRTVIVLPKFETGTTQIKVKRATKLTTLIVVVVVVIVVFADIAFFVVVFQGIFQTKLFVRFLPV